MEQDITRSLWEPLHAGVLQAGGAAMASQMTTPGHHAVPHAGPSTRVTHAVTHAGPSTSGRQLARPTVWTRPCLSLPHAGKAACMACVHTFARCSNSMYSSSPATNRSSQRRWAKGKGLSSGHTPTEYDTHRPRSHVNALLRERVLVWGRAVLLWGDMSGLSCGGRHGVHRGSSVLAKPLGWNGAQGELRGS